MKKFPYREEGNPPVLRPTVDVELSFGPNAQWRTRALIDTGSPITVFDYASAEALLVRFNCERAKLGSIASHDGTLGTAAAQAPDAPDAG